MPTTTKKSASGNLPEALKIRFTKSPTGTFNLAYSEGDEAEFSMAQAAELIEAGYAIALGTEA